MPETSTTPEYGEVNANVLRDSIVEDLRGRSEWAEKQTAIYQRRLGSRPKVKTYPYKNAPNFVVPIIDDAVREKTDQEVSMLWNAPRIAHAVPLGPVGTTERGAIELFFDSYIRYIIRARRTIARAMDAKNSQGFAILKITRKYNELLGRAVPDFEVTNQFDIIVPVDTEDLQNAERVTEVLRLSKREFDARAEARGWQNADDVWQHAKRTGREERQDEDDYFEKVKSLVGLATSPKDEDYIVVWVTYHYADEMDAAYDAQSISVGDRVVTIFSPECPQYILTKYPWRDGDVVEVDDDGNETMVERGKPRAWPFVQCPYEDRSPYYYDQRGGGELCMDDQLEATASKNAKFVLMDYYQNPILRGASRNPGNIRFAPGTFVEQGVDFLPPPQIPQNFDFSVNDAKANAAKRLGAGGMYNYTTDMGGRKLQKSATEVQVMESKTAGISSASVDLFNEPLAVAFQMLWEDMARMRLVFPLVQPDATDPQMMSEQLYSAPVLMVPASSAKTLNPDSLLQRQMAFVEFLSGKMQMGVPFNLTKACQDVAAQFDSRLTRDWIIDPQQAGPQGQPPIYTMLAQLGKNIQMLAKGGQDHEERMKNLEQMVVKLAKGARQDAAS